MRRFVYQLVDRLHDADSGLSRNRQPTLLDTPAGQRALRLHRHLRSLDTDLARHADAVLQAVREPAGWRVTVTIPSVKLTRVAHLTADDLDVLAGHPGPLASRLVEAGVLPEPGTGTP